MAQRVTGGARALDRVLAAAGRAARPLLRAAARRAELPADGRLELPGLGAPVEVAFDEHGVPHVRAASDADAFRAQGFVHARDRWFQMDMLRRVLRGRLAEVVGERPLGAMALPPFGERGTTLDADRLMRALDLLPAARRVWRQGGEEGRALLRAYVAGVNAAVGRMRRRRPLEHRLLRLPLRPWSPVDSILVAKGMALGLSFKWRTAPVFTALAEALAADPDLVHGLLPRVPGQGALAIVRCVAEGVGQALRFLPPDTPTVGSNAWLVGGARSASGKPLLANDPHLELGLPGIWYLASLRGRDYAAVGATLPGLPGVVIGRTPTLAWGVTNGMLDDCDLWVETLDADGRRYQVDGAWRDLRAETQSMPCRGRAPVPFVLRRTHRGPLISDAFPGYGGSALSLRMTLHEPTQDMEAFLGLGRARTVDEGLAAARLYGSPAQNLLLADATGRCAYRLMGRVPRRTLTQHPVFPRDGSTAASDWQGWVPDEELPCLAPGPEGQIVSANHPQADAGYPHYLSHLYEPDYRALRIDALLRGRRGLTADDMRAVQGDAVNLAAARLRETVFAPHAAEVRRRRPTLAPLLDRLVGWDGAEGRDDAGGVAWHLAYHHLARRVFGPRLGEELTAHWMGLMNLVDDALLRAFEDPASPWAPPARRPELLLDALEDTARDLQRRGLQPDSPWGALHRLTLRHPLGTVAPLAPTWNRGPLPMDGGPYSVCSGQYLHARPGPMAVGQSYLQVVDLGDPEGARMITFGGQSGHAGSRHYDDLTPLWRRRETIPMRLETLPEGGRRLRLEPR